MGAKDTVMDFVAISDASLVVFAGEYDEEYCTHLRVAQAQAEITWPIAFEAGREEEKAHWIREIESQVHDAYKAGQREVWDWLKHYDTYSQYTGKDHSELVRRHDIPNKDIEAKLKEWGL